MVVAAFSHSLRSFGSCGRAAVTVAVDFASGAYATAEGASGWLSVEI